MGSEDIADDSVKPAPNRVEVSLEQVFRAKDRIYIRYSVANQTDARSGRQRRMCVFRSRPCSLSLS